MSWQDYTETRAIVALVFTIVLTVALFAHFVSGGEFVAGLTAILAAFTAHSLCDDKLPDRNQ